MNLLPSLRSEITRSKRTAAFYFTLLGAAVIPVMFLFNIVTDGLPNENASNKDPLNAMFGLAAEVVGIFIFPLFTVLACTLVPQIEHRNNTWKQVLASPQTKADIFLSKFLNVQLLLLGFLLASHLFMWVAAVAAHFFLPQLNVLNQPLNGAALLQKAVSSYLMVLGLCAIQFWLGLRFKNFLVPVAVGLMLWLTGCVMVFEYHSKAARFFPYSFPAVGFSADYQPSVVQVQWTSVAYLLIVLTFAFLDFRRRRMVG